MLRLLLAPVVVAGCGRVAFDPRIDALGDGLGDALAADCWPAWRAHTPSVSAPQRIDSLSTALGEGNPFLTDDGRTLYYDQSDGVNPRDLFVAERAGAGQPFGVGALFAPAKTSSDEGRLTESADRSIAVFVSDRPGGEGGGDLWMMVRDPATGGFGAPDQTLVGAVNTPTTGEQDPELSDDALRVYLSPSSGQGTQIIVMAERARVTDPFGSPVDLNVGPVGKLSDPTLSPDELVLVFSYEINGVDINDLYYTTRTTRDEPFGALEEVPSLASPSNDADGALSADGCELYFRSDRTGAGDLYLASITPP